MCLLKRVIRDITNPQYWAKLSLNPLMIAVFFWCTAQVFINPFGVGGTPGVEGVGLFPQTEAWDPDLPHTSAPSPRWRCQCVAVRPGPEAGSTLGRQTPTLWSAELPLVGCPVIGLLLAPGLFGAQGVGGGGGRRQEAGGFSARLLACELEGLGLQGVTLTSPGILSHLVTGPRSPVRKRRREGEGRREK